MWLGDISKWHICNVLQALIVGHQSKMVVVKTANQKLGHLILTFQFTGVTGKIVKQHSLDYKV